MAEFRAAGTTQGSMTACKWYNRSVDVDVREWDSACTLTSFTITETHAKQVHPEIRDASVLS
jgi:hypothetical protein